MTRSLSIEPAQELAGHGQRRFPGEGEQYRQGRTALLAEEIELRRHIERIAVQRRALNRLCARAKQCFGHLARQQPSHGSRGQGDGGEQPQPWLCSSFCRGRSDGRIATSAWWRARRVTGMLKTGAQVDMWFRTTLGLQRRGGRWLITHDDGSVPFDPKSGQASLGLQP